MTLAIYAVLLGIGRETEEAAAILGANRRQIFFSVDVASRFEACNAQKGGEGREQPVGVRDRRLQAAAHLFGIVTGSRLFQGMPESR